VPSGRIDVYARAADVGHDHDVDQLAPAELVQRRAPQIGVDARRVEERVLQVADSFLRVAREQQRVELPRVGVAAS
jgi:hypothetical protein